MTFISHVPTAVLPNDRHVSCYDEHRGQHTPLIIDNGSTHLRYGFCSDSVPCSALNVVAKYKERKYNKQLLLFGEAIDADTGAKAQARSPWEADVLLNFDAMVCYSQSTVFVRFRSNPGKCS
jgi:actin-related protein 5